ncbi:MAG TPA: peptide deformylase [Gammaproteobacteria bacterium]|nr:peptide deformylase [Gammaproteobacteria bacterium]
MSPAPAKVLLIGDPRLREVSAPVGDVNDPGFLCERQALAETLEEFRRAHGFGRAVSAPQIGVAKRFIALNLDDRPQTIVNPAIVWRDARTFTLWDDCMSFPFLLVRVSRSESISVKFSDERGQARVWEKLDRATSELLQHEIDHLDGILAVDRAVDRQSLVSREVFEANRDAFARQVDYTIGGT